MIEAGLTATGIQGFWVRAVVGLVFLAAVVFHLTMEQPQRRAKIALLLRLRLKPGAEALSAVGEEPPSRVRSKTTIGGLA